MLGELLFTIAAVGMLGLAVGFLIMGVSLWRASPPGSGGNGGVKVTGTAKQLDDTVQSPATDEECLAYTAYLRKRTRSSDHRRGRLISRPWGSTDDERVTTTSYKEGTDFLVETDTGDEYIVEMPGRLGPIRSLWRRITGRDYWLGIGPYIEFDSASASSEEWGWRRDAKTTTTERLLFPGDEIVVYGAIEDTPEGDPPRITPGTPGLVISHQDGTVNEAGLVVGSIMFVVIALFFTVVWGAAALGLINV